MVLTKILKIVLQGQSVCLKVALMDDNRNAEQLIASIEKKVPN